MLIIFCEHFKCLWANVLYFYASSLVKFYPDKKNEFIIVLQHINMLDGIFMPKEGEFSFNILCFIINIVSFSIIFINIISIIWLIYKLEDSAENLIR